MKVHSADHIVSFIPPIILLGLCFKNLSFSLEDGTAENNGPSEGLLFPLYCHETLIIGTKIWCEPCIPLPVGGRKHKRLVRNSELKFDFSFKHRLQGPR